MHGWADLFQSTHCADDGPGKPHPAMVLEAMRACGARPDQTLMIGDSVHDMRMAKAAGVRAQGVSWGFNTAAELHASGADHVADDFTVLNKQLDAFSEAPPRA
jgi:phosphoglycolate phosphatase